MKFILNKDNLNIEGSQILNSGSTGYYEVEVEHDEEWNGLTIAVVMIKKGESIGKNVSVVNNKVCIDRAVYGSYSLGVIGYKIENEQKIYQISTNMKSVYFDKGAGEIETQNESIPTVSEWEVYIEQIQTIFNDIETLNNGLYEKVEEVEGKLANGDYDGKDGATFIPNVDEEGNLSWSNDKGLENPPTINIKGEKGEGGSIFTVTTILPEKNSEGYSVLKPNTKYYLGEMEELSIAFPKGELGQEIDVQFITKGVEEELATTFNINSDNINKNFKYTLNAKKIYELKAVYGVIGINDDNTLMYGWNLTLNETEMVDKRLQYIPIEYIESTGTQYIDTEIKGSNSTEFEISFNQLNAGKEYQATLGGRTSSSYRGLCYCNYRNNSATLKIMMVANTENKFSVASKQAGFEEDVVVSFKNNILTNSLGMSQNYTNTNTQFNYTTDYNLYIFGINNAGTFVDPSNMKLYYCKFWENGELVRDFVPAKNKSGIACLYDKVSKTFFYNKGTGDFVAGPDM